MYMGKPQTFDIIAVSIPDSNVQKAVARLMVGADRYLSMQEALDQVSALPVTLFKNTELKDAEQHVAKLKALGVGFRIVQADGTEDDSIISDADLPGGAPMKSVGPTRHEEAHPRESVTPSSAFGAPPPPVSILDAISHHHSDPGGAKKGPGGPREFTGFGSAGGSGGAYASHGIRANTDMPGSLKKSEEAAARKRKLVSIIMAAAVVIIALLFYLVPKGKIYHFKKITIQSIAKEKGIKHKSSDKTGGGSSESGAAPQNPTPNPPEVNPEANAEAKSRRADNSNSRGGVNNRQRQQANNYVDSAKIGGDLERQVAFYKIAISFNQYNLQAWHGLLQAYREMNDRKNVAATEAQMKEIFGKEVNSVNAAVAQYGEIVDAYTNESGAYRVEYKTKKTSKEEILRDVFNLTRAIRNSCNCHNISVYASTGPGNGLMVHSTAETPVHTLPEFSKHANILWFD
jgi:hypothetical protein